MKEIITANSNKQVKNVINLQKSKKARTEQGYFVCEGRRMFEEARDCALAEIVRAYVSESFYNDYIQGDTGYMGDCDYEIVKDSVFSGMSETVTPQGVMAVVRQAKYNLDEVIGGPARLLLLEDIQDPGNLGTLIRTAEAAGISGIVMSIGTADVYNPKVIRSTMGSVFRVPFIYVPDMPETVAGLVKAGIKVYAAYLHGGVDYRTADYSGACGVMIGNEGNGLTREAVEAATGAVYIPMAGKVESLNAAIAGAQMMFEMTRIGR